MVPDLSTILAFSAATIALLFIPGPAVVYILNRSVSDGRDVGLSAVLGLEVGDAIQATFAALGLSAVLAASASLFNIVKWAGVVYLLYVGIRTLLTQPSTLGVDHIHVSRAQAFRQGIVVNALNPKTALFFLSIFPQFVDPDAPHAQTQSLVLGAIFVLLATLFNATLSLTASALRDLLLKGRGLYIMRRYISAAMFIGLGLLAATAGHASASSK